MAPSPIGAEACVRFVGGPATAILLAVAASGGASAQAPMSPAFGAAIVNGPGLMALGMGPRGDSRVCGRAYSDDLERDHLRALEAAGRCGSAAGAPPPPSAPTSVGPVAFGKPAALTPTEARASGR